MVRNWLQRRYAEDVRPWVQKNVPEKVQDLVQRKMMAWAIPFVRRSGFSVQAMERGHVACTMPLAPNRNHIGTMYAGALFTLAELPGGALFLSSFDTADFYPIVKEMNIRFLKPADGAVSIEINLSEAEIQRLQAEALSRGKAEFILEGELKNAAGDIVASSRGVYQIRRRS